MTATIPTTAEPLAVNERHAAKLLNVSPRTVFNLTASGKLRSFKIGTRKLYSVASLQKFIADQESLCSSGQPR